MKFFKMAVLAVSLVLGVQAWAQTPNHPAYFSQGLTEVINRALTATRGGQKTVAMFDLDDTLIDTRERNVRILRDFASQPAIQTAFPADARRILTLRLPQIHFLLNDTLAALGVTNPALLQQANTFWTAAFFSNKYCAFDQPNPGAAQYLQTLDRAGAQIVYLTGRDIPRMKQGTIFNLRRNQFPTAPGKDFLVMKPDPTTDDLVFKESQFQKIASLGTVIAVFENEPVNLNAMAAAFPDAFAIFLDTIHSPRLDVPEARAIWVPNFFFPIPGR